MIKTIPKRTTSTRTGTFGLGGSKAGDHDDIEEKLKRKKLP
jgi:hypothetical protein